MRTEGVARLAPTFPSGVKPLSVTLSKVRNFQSVSTRQVKQLRWTESLINMGVISSSWREDNNMAEIWERQNVWKEQLSTQHVCLVLGPCYGLVHVCVESLWLCAPSPRARQCVSTVFACVPTWACAWVICGQSHPSGVWYLIAWIDRSKESVTFSSYYNAASTPNKAVEQRW